MNRHLFLEGPVGEGKSTLIRMLIKDHLPFIGGFSSQRLLNESGVTAGFRLVPAAEAMSLTAEYSSGLSDTFLSFDGEKTAFKPEVFSDTAIEYLRAREGKKLILMDETGGIELSVPDFRQALYEVLSCGIPCLGVLKPESGIRTICSQITVNHDCINHHLKLRADLIDRMEATIIEFERSHSEEAEKAIKVFLAPVFG
ncbi:MAG: nucleoside-triphosphatase [Eubacteriales bacterium]|nr:nucleoside-triphosphatase [Eubacteriales bacterium]